MAKLYNRVRQNVSGTPGTGTVSLGAAYSNAFFTFAEAGVSNGDQVVYVIEDGTDFELGLGTYTSAGTTLSRDTVRKSKFSGTAGTAKLTLTSAAQVRITALKEDIANLGEAQTFVGNQAITGTLTVSGLITATAGQISFPASQNASADANTLDDYEEGTWTPSLGGSTTYTTQTGTYTKIGNLVVLRGRVTVNAIGTGSVNSIVGVPFAAAAFSSGHVGYFASINSSVTSLSCYISASTIETTGLTAAAASITDGISTFKNGADVIFTIAYTV